MALDEGTPPPQQPQPESQPEPAFPGSNTPKNWRQLADGTDQPGASAFPNRSAPENWRDIAAGKDAPNEPAYPQSGVPRGFERPEEDRRPAERGSSERPSAEDMARDAGRTFGQLKNLIDRKYDDVQARRAAGGPAAGASGRVGAGAPSSGRTPDSAGLPGGGPKVGSGAAAGAGKGKMGGGGGKLGGVNAEAALDQGKELLRRVPGAGAAGAEALDKVEEKVDQTVSWLLVAVYAILSWVILIGSVTTLFFTGILGALVGIFPLVSAKYSYKIIVWILDLFGIGEFLEMTIDADKIQLSGLQKLATALNAVLVLLFWVLLFGGLLVIMIYGVCKPLTSGLVGAGVSVGTAVTDTVGATSGWSSAVDFCKKFTGGVESFLSGSGSTNSTGAAKSIEAYAPLLKQIAQENGVEYCALEALMRKESGADRYAYSTVYYSGSKYTGIGPSGKINPSNPPPYYALTFTGQGHAIGLLQIMVYNDGRGWQNSTTPSRSGGEFGFPGRYLTLTDLIDENTNIKAGTGFYISKLKSSGNDPVQAYSKYQGSSSIVDPATLEKFRSYYDSCKTR